jgi:hypothetical protein
VKWLIWGRPRRRTLGLLEPTSSALKMRCDAPTVGATTRGGGELSGPYVTGGTGVFLPSGGKLDALPMPLGSLSALGLPGPNGMPLIGELPAPADPAGGVSCA